MKQETKELCLLLLQDRQQLHVNRIQKFSDKLLDESDGTERERNIWRNNIKNHYRDLEKYTNAIKDITQNC